MGWVGGLQWSAALCCVIITATSLRAITVMRYFPIVPEGPGRPFVSTQLQCFEESGLGREVTRSFGGGGRREE